MLATYKSIVPLMGMCLLLIACNAVKESAENNAWALFYGTYQGNSEPAVDGEIAERDLTVIIEPWRDKGFSVNWKTVIYRVNGKTKEADMAINFYPSERPGVFASAMTTDVFGQSVPHDPIAGDAEPYVWAGIEGSTLTVSAMYIVDGGGYELQVYKRSLTEGGLALEFERTNNGEKITRVKAQLEKVDK